MVSIGMVNNFVAACARRRPPGLCLLSALLGWVAIFSGCSPGTPDSADVIVLHTGRMRGNVYPLSLQSFAPLQHYQYVAGYVKAVREEAEKTGAQVLLIDLGDSLTGSFASHVTASRNMVTFFNDCRYDAIVLSNLDHAVPPETLAELKAKVLNPFQDANGKPATAGTHFGTRLGEDGLPIFLLANFYGDTKTLDAPDRFPTRFGSTASKVAPIRDYRDTVKALNRPENGSLTLLSWMKFESPENPPEAFLAQLRELEVDAILAHRIYGKNQRAVWASGGLADWKPPASLNILRNNGGFALARLDLKRSGDSWQVLRHELIPMTANRATADKAIVEAIDQLAPAISEADTPLLNLKEIVPPEALLAIYMRALTAEPGTEAVLYSLQSIRSEWIPGELSSSQLFNSLPWTTPLIQIALTPEQISSASRDLGLVAWQMDSAPGPTLMVTTSWYFGQLLLSRFELPPEALRQNDLTSEFDRFAQYLKAHPNAVEEAGPPPGWSESERP